MTGNDVLFGEGQDDDLIGGWGHDWISGGTGQDGVLGDDGRIFTSRNVEKANNHDTALSEPLNGIAKLDKVGEVISTPGNHQQATIHINGALKKTFDLTPFNVGRNGDQLFDASHSDDIIYGGLGDDFLHGGSGDDAISGAEALPIAAAQIGNSVSQARLVTGYDIPVNLGDVLGFERFSTSEFALYDEFLPTQRIFLDADGQSTADSTAMDFLLNFNKSEGPAAMVGSGLATDGNDVIFGDLGNDWLVGGTGRDHVYGGYGDDLLNADDDLTTDGGANVSLDGTDASYADIAFGGAGRDFLIANIQDDRLIDWTGNFNTYIVTGSSESAPTVSRGVPPDLNEYLYDLSAADGADPTRAADASGGSASAIERNGEPEGELELIISDLDWESQTGGPIGTNVNAIPSGQGEVIQSANFNNGSADAFGADSGLWSVRGGRLEVAPEVLGADAVSVLYISDYLPGYFEIQATINAGKPVAGFKSNAYLIFDYQSPNDFKFAGVNISTDKLEMGYRDASGWHVLEQTPSQLRPDKDYNLLLALNDTVATLVVDHSQVFSHGFAPRIDPFGYAFGLNGGMVGIGANNSVARIDNVAVTI